MPYVLKIYNLRTFEPFELDGWRVYYHPVNYRYDYPARSLTLCPLEMSFCHLEGHEPEELKALVQQILNHFRANVAS